MISSYILILLAILCIISYYAFILPNRDKILFELYKDRDDLTLYAMSISGKQDTKEYKYVIGTINTEIYLIKNNFSFCDFYKSTVEITVENKNEIEKTLAVIEQDEYIKQIFEHSFGIFSNYMNKKIKVFNNVVLRPVVFILSGIIKVLEIFSEDNCKKISYGIEVAFKKASDIPKVYEQYMNVNKAL